MGSPVRRIALMCVVLVACSTLWACQRALPHASPPAEASSAASSTPDRTTAANEPAADDVPLRRVTSPPPATVAMIEPSAAQEGSRYAVVFVPYGEGPPAGTTPRLVVSISTSVADAGVTKPYDFAGRNALVDVSELPAEDAITQGGTYEGTIVLVKQGDLLVPRLVNAVRAK